MLLILFLESLLHFVFALSEVAFLFLLLVIVLACFIEDLLLSVDAILK